MPGRIPSLQVYIRLTAFASPTFLRQMITTTTTTAGSARGTRWKSIDILVHAREAVIRQAALNPFQQVLRGVARTSPVFNHQAGYTDAEPPGYLDRRLEQSAGNRLLVASPLSARVVPDKVGQDVLIAQIGDHDRAEPCHTVLLIYYASPSRATGLTDPSRMAGISSR